MAEGSTPAARCSKSRSSGNALVLRFHGLDGALLDGELEELGPPMARGLADIRSSCSESHFRQSLGFIVCFRTSDFADRRILWASICAARRVSHIFCLSKASVSTLSSFCVACSEADLHFCCTWLAEITMAVSRLLASVANNAWASCRCFWNFVERRPCSSCSCICRRAILAHLSSSCFCFDSSLLWSRPFSSSFLAETFCCTLNECRREVSSRNCSVSSSCCLRRSRIFASSSCRDCS
mmetsp:Transcript_75021/g.135118  ORF Transcript_75021/g.135118 Transcript_75021/m.135118 type:complete len:239 (-) Transcript_75021:1623-2339(-)